jgi:hypothetical protein
MNGHISFLTANLRGRELKAALKYAEQYDCGGSLERLYEAVVFGRPPAGVGAKTRRRLGFAIIGAITLIEGK